MRWLPGTHEQYSLLSSTIFRPMTQLLLAIRSSEKWSEPAIFHKAPVWFQDF